MVFKYNKKKKKQKYQNLNNVIIQKKYGDEHD